jgi:heat shock protein HslJ
MNITRILSLLSLVFLIGMTACGGALGGSELEGTSWVLVSYGGNPILPNTKPSLNFEDGTAGGNSSCNHFGGEYQVRGNTIAFNNLAWTLMACQDGGVMDQEQAYMRMLGGELHYQIVDGQLILTTEKGQLLVFDPVE